MEAALKISGGVYLVLDPAMKESELLEKLKRVLKYDIAAVQLWDNFPPSAEIEELINKVCEVAHRHQVPVLINNRPELVKNTAADGVHFDEIPEDFQSVRKEIGKQSIVGITCTNDLEVINWASANELDYISFCSIFPSVTSNSCELVSFDIIKKAREITSMPIFLAGGVRPENIKKLKELQFEGVAVISGIMGSDDPDLATNEYITQLNYLENEKRNHK